MAVSEQSNLANSGLANLYWTSLGDLCHSAGRALQPVRLKTYCAILRRSKANKNKKSPC
jgi:hypothetical protein